MKFKMAATAGLSLTLDPMGKMFQNAFDAICTCVGARTEMTLLLSAFNSICM
jgi:hypothetical protein